MPDGVEDHGAGYDRARRQLRPDRDLEQPRENLAPGESVFFERRPRLAALIDAENIPARTAGWLFRELHRHGNPIIRRVFGDFSDAQLVGWFDAAERFRLESARSLLEPDVDRM